MPQATDMRGNKRVALHQTAQIESEAKQKLQNKYKHLSRLFWAQLLRHLKPLLPPLFSIHTPKIPHQKLCVLIQEYEGTSEYSCNTYKNKWGWQWPSCLPGHLLAWMDGSIKLQDAKGRKKIEKGGGNWEKGRVREKKRCNNKTI